jgi:Protein of unknown function (DUF2795)
MNLDKLETRTLLEYLPGVTFPAEKEHVASTAENNNAPEEMIWRIRHASNTRFNYPDNVLEAVQGRRVF